MSTGDDITASILATMALRDIGVREVYVKVISFDHVSVDRPLSRGPFGGQLRPLWQGPLGHSSTPASAGRRVPSPLCYGSEASSARTGQITAAYAANRTMEWRVTAGSVTARTTAILSDVDLS